VDGVIQRAFGTSGSEDDALAVARALLRSGQPDRAVAWLREAERKAPGLIEGTASDAELTGLQPRLAAS